MLAGTQKIKILSCSWLVIFVLLLSGFPAQLMAADEDAYKFKAAYIYNFLQFIEFGNLKVSATYNLCLYTNKPVPAELEALSGRTLAEKNIAVITLTAPSGIDSCHLVFFIGPNETPTNPNIKAAAKLGALTLGENEDFLNSGGMINFVLKENKLRFQVNLAAVKEANIEIRSRLLKLADEVRP